MKTKIQTLIAVITFAASSWATDTIIDNQRPPDQRITLQNNVAQVVTQVMIPFAGHWNFSGGSTVQLNAAPGTRGQFLYTLAALTTDPNALDAIDLRTIVAMSSSPAEVLARIADIIRVIPLDGSIGLIANPYGTWWFPADSKTHSFRLQSGQTMYLVVKYYGQTPVQLAQAFGSINGIRVPAN